jgi:type I restriction enzyme S subunit
VRSSWESRPLGEIVEFQRGLTYSKSDEVDSSSNIVVRANNIDLTSNLLDLTELRHISNKIEIPASKKLRRNSLLICTASGSKSHLGKVALVDADYDYAFGGFMGQLTAKPTLNPKYLFYFMISDGYKDHIRALSDGININNLRFDDLKPLAIPKPPLPEQHRIVAILDEAFAGLATATANTEKNLGNARELFESYLTLVFNEKGIGWSHRIVGDLCELISGQHIDAKDYNTIGKGLAYITGPSDFGRISPVISKWTEVPKRMARKNDILITVKGSGVGSINLLDADEVAISRQLMAIRARATNRDFLYFFLKLQRSYFQSLALGAAIPGISRGDVLNLPIWLPGRAVQNEIVTQIKAFEMQLMKLQANYRQRLVDISELKQTLLQKAFSGELTAPPMHIIQQAAE